MSGHICRVCGSVLSVGEKRCSFCGTTTEDYTEPHHSESYYQQPKYTSSYYEKNNSTNRPPQNGYQNYHNSTRVINDYASRNADIEITDSSVTIRDAGREKVYPTRIDPTATHTKTKSNMSWLWLLILLPFIFAIFSGIAIAIGFLSVREDIGDLLSGNPNGSAIISASQEIVETDYWPEIDTDDRKIGEPVDGVENLYYNGEYYVYKLESSEYIEGETYEDDQFYVREFYVFIEPEYIDIEEIDGGPYGLYMYKDGYNIGVNSVDYEERFEYIYVGTQDTIHRRNNFSVNDMKFEVYEVESPYDKEYHIFAHRIGDDTRVLYLNLMSDDSMDYFDVFKYVEKGIQKNDD